MKLRPRLRTVLIAVNLAVLALPVGGVLVLRLYESTLIRRTESELIVQGAHVASLYREAVRDELASRTGGVEPDEFGGPLEPDPKPWSRRDGVVVPDDLPPDLGFTPVPASLDLATHQVLPRPEDAREPSVPADPVAAAAGAEITPVIEGAQQVTLCGIRVVDHQGTVVASTGTELGLSLAHREEVQRALEGMNVSLMRERVSDEPPPPIDSLSRETQVRVFVAMPVIVEGRVWGAVVLSRTPMSMRQSLYRVRWYLPASLGALVAVVAFISLLISRTIARPMKQLIGQTERVARGERGAATPLPRPGTREFEQVSEAVARMAQALEQRAAYIETFASNVSHEFKTPLTSIRGTVELLRDHLDEMSPEERARFLDNLEADAERLDRLTRRLTELARADVLRPGDEVTEVGPVVEAVASQLAGKGLTVQVERGDDGATVRMGREVLESVVGNLLDNARQHGGEGVRAVVEVSRGRGPVGEQVQIRIEDDGPGISEANARKVFERFFTTAREAGGSGLGLSIVQTLVEAHGGSIELDSRPGRTVFRVALPVTPAPGG